MPRFIVNISLELPAIGGDKAMEKVNEFFSCVLVAGRPVRYSIMDIQLVKPDVATEE